MTQNMLKGWNYDKLGFILDISSGKARPKTEGKYPVYGGNGILNYTDKYNQENIIIVGRVGAYCGSVYFEKNKLWLSDNALGITNNENSDINYLYYLLTYLNLNRNAIGGAQPLLTQGIVNGIELSYPPLPEQQAIASVLSSLDDKIELLREQNKTLESITQTLFHEWFVKFNFPIGSRHSERSEESPEYQGYADAGGEMIDSELGDIPKGWRVGKVGDLLERHQVSKTYSKDDVKQYGHIPVYEQGQGLLLGFIDDEPTFSATPLEPIFIFGDHTCVTKLLLEPFSLSSNTIPITGKDYPTIWVYYATSRLQDFLEYRRHRMERTHKELAIPPIDLATGYSVIIKPILEKVLQNEHKIQTLSKTRDMLLPKLMSGEVRVKF